MGSKARAGQAVRGAAQAARTNDSGSAIGHLDIS
jgi:hypothetical protein